MAAHQAAQGLAKEPTPKGVGAFVQLLVSLHRPRSDNQHDTGVGRGDEDQVTSDRGESMSNNQLNDALASNYLLADIQLRSWSGKRTDKGATEELIASKNAAKDSGAFVKNLMASARDELDQVHRCGTAIRNFV